MVFVIEHTQNLDSEAMQVKLDELIRAIDDAPNALLDPDHSRLIRRSTVSTQVKGRRRVVRADPAESSSW